MARRRSGLSPMLSLALAVMAAMCAASTAQQQPPAMPAVPTVPTAPSCQPVQASLSPCVSYFIGNSSTPSTACCSQVQAMFESQAPCLCTAVAAVPSQLGAVLGQVLPLPSACNLPPNACSSVTGTSGSAPDGGGAAAAPSSGTPAAAAAPVAGPDGTIPATHSDGGSKTVPGLPDSAAVKGAECTRISAAAAAVLASLLAAYVF